MAIVNQLEISLQVGRKNDLVLIHAVQGESYSRQVTANLYTVTNNVWERYTIPNEAIALIRYRKPDGKVGFYDFDPAGNRIVNIPTTGTYANKQVIFTIPPEMCDVPGRVFAHIDLYKKTDGTRLSAFYFQVEVEKAATDPEIYSQVNVSGFSDLLRDILESVYQGETEDPEGVILDNTLTLPGAAAEAKATGDLILIQETQPIHSQTPRNEIWFNNGPAIETEVPEMSNVVSSWSTDKVYTYGDYAAKDGVIYKFISQTPYVGEWDARKWTSIKLCDELSALFRLIADSSS